MKVVKTCVQEDDYEIFESMRDWITGVMEHICDDNGSRISKSIRRVKSTTILRKFSSRI